MRTVYMIRGQSSGVFFDAVFYDYPTEDDLKKALARELAAHGFDPKAEEPTPRERWVQVQEATLVGGPDGPSVEPMEHARISGKISAETLRRMFDAAPPTTAVAGVGEVSATGSGSVVNPGDPGHVPGKK